MAIKLFTLPRAAISTLAAAVFITACSNDAGDQTSTEAALSFSHNYDGSVTVGKTELIKLNFTEQYEAGVISITVHGDDGVSFSSLTAESFALENSSSIAMDLALTAPIAGDYSVIVLADINDGAGNRTQETFGLDITATP